MGDIQQIVAAVPGWRVVFWKLPDVGHDDELAPGEIDDAPDSELLYVAHVACWALTTTDDGADTTYVTAVIAEDLPAYMKMIYADDPFLIMYLAPSEDVDAEIAGEARRKALAWLERSAV